MVTHFLLYLMIRRSFWKNMKDDNLLVIGIMCNYSTGKWQWIDGSEVNYKPARYSKDLDEQCSLQKYAGSWSLLRNGNWTFLNLWSMRFNVSCIANLPQFKITDECSEFDQYEKGSMCYQVFNKTVNWTIANALCESVGANLASLHSRDDNGFLRRLAFSRGLVDGIFLGAAKSGKDAFQWADSSIWNYTNFASGSPVNDSGNCLTMISNEMRGQWTNKECSSKMSFACSRKPFEKKPTSSCPDESVKEGSIIVSPGFPLNSSQECDFSLKVDDGKKVEVEVSIYHMYHESMK
ncbi:hypothetical protein PMAYCL1PPCAC_13634, partial [Pristionchus mayeri]